MRPLSWLQLYWLVIGEVFIGGFTIVVASYWKIAAIGDVMAYCSILFGATGTALMILPSAITTFGRTEDSAELQAQFQMVREVVHQLLEGETLTKSDEGYRELVEYMDDVYGLDKDPSKISLSEEVEPPLFNFDGDTRFPSIPEFFDTLESNEERIEARENTVSEKRERNHVLAGGVLYGFAIILQNINTFL